MQLRLDCCMFSLRKDLIIRVPEFVVESRIGDDSV